MKTFLKWAIILIVVVGVVGFGAFLYMIPPFTLVPPEEFSSQEANAAPTVEHITDPAQRKMAERGRYIVVYTGCTGCHTPGGENGPSWEKYLAGGAKLIAKGFGTVVTRNLTPDETGLVSRTDEQVHQVLRNGIFHTGRLIHGRNMPWTTWSNWTDEDMRAVIVYLRNLKPVKQTIPDWTPEGAPEDPTALEAFYAGNYSLK